MLHLSVRWGQVRLVAKANFICIPLLTSSPHPLAGGASPPSSFKGSGTSRVPSGDGRTQGVQTVGVHQVPARASVLGMGTSEGRSDGAVKTEHIPSMGLSSHHVDRVFSQSILP